MRTHYENAKRQNPGMLLLFRLGDYYAAYSDDARNLARIVGLTVTSRDTFPTAGFPHHQLEPYLQKLLQAGQRVAICEQVADAPKRANIERHVTPGSLV